VAVALALVHQELDEFGGGLSIEENEVGLQDVRNVLLLGLHGHVGGVQVVDKAVALVEVLDVADLQSLELIPTLEFVHDAGEGFGHVGLVEGCSHPTDEPAEVLEGALRYLHAFLEDDVVLESEHAAVLLFVHDLACVLVVHLLVTEVSVLEFQVLQNLVLPTFVHLFDFLCLQVLHPLLLVFEQLLDGEHVFYAGADCCLQHGTQHLPVLDRLGVLVLLNRSQFVLHVAEELLRGLDEFPDGFLAFGVLAPAVQQEEGNVDRVDGLAFT